MLVDHLTMYRSENQEKMIEKTDENILLLSARVSFSLDKYPPFYYHVVDDIHVLLDRNNQRVRVDHEGVLN